MVQLIFFVLAILLGFTGIYFLWSDPHGDLAFASIVLTLSAAFLSYRFKIKNRMNGRAGESDD